MVTTFPVISPVVIRGLLEFINIFLSNSFGCTAALNPARCSGRAVMARLSVGNFVLNPVIAEVVVGVFQVLVGRNGEFGPVLTFF